MAAAALQMEMNAMWLQVILAGFAEVLFTSYFLYQMKMIMASSPFEIIIKAIIFTT